MTPPRRSRARVLRRGLAAFAALVVVTLLLQPWWLAPLASHHLSASARRPVHFDSMWVALSGTLQPVLHMRGVRIDNAPWADSRRPFAALGEAAAVFSWRSLPERRPIIALMVLRDGEVDLERRADGLRNWRLSEPDYRGPGRFKVLAIQGDHAAVRFAHELLELDLEATASASPEQDAGGRATTTRSREGGAAASMPRSEPGAAAPMSSSDLGASASAPSSDPGAAAEPMPTRLDVRGTWRGVPFALDATTGEVLTFAETGRMFRARGRIVSGAARIDFDGHLGDIVRDPLFDSRVAAAAPSLAPFAGVLGPHRGEGRAIALTGDLKGAPGRYAVAIATARFGATDLAGELSWTRGDGRDLARIKLASESASLADLRSLAGRQPAKAIERVAVAASAPASAPRAAPRPLDVELSFAARRLRGEGMPWLHGGAVEARLADGRLAVSHFDVGIDRGHAIGKASIDIGARPMQGSAEFDLSAIRIESFVPAQAARNLLSGTLHGSGVLKASGDSAEALLASAAGRVSAFVSSGTISSLLDAEVGLQGGRVVRSMLAGAEPVAIRCAAAIVDLERGVGRIRTLVVDTERTRTAGSGTIDLANRSFDVVLTPEAKQPGFFILERSIRLHGPLREPRHELVARVAPGSEPVRSCRAERP